MFSYRHGFHAGNHADVLKHMVLVQMLEHLLQKEKPFWVIDTHAGGGIYDLTSGYATKSAEADSGVNTLWPLRNKKATPEAVKSYLAQVAALNSGEVLQWYPGSPQLAAQMLRQGDHLRMYELHPTEIKLLRGHFESVRRGVSIEEADGFTGLRGILPPPPKRGLVHIDPPYEAKEDYKRVLQTLKEAIPRFSTGTYAIWYPEVARMESQQFGGQLRRLGGSLEKVDWLHATLRVKGAEKGGLGLYGSGMFIVNPPWTLYDRLAEALPWLVETLGVDDYAAYTLEAQQS